MTPRRDTHQGAQSAALSKRLQASEREAKALRRKLEETREMLERSRRSSKRAKARVKRLDATSSRVKQELDEARRALSDGALRRGLPALATPVFFLTGRAKSGTSWLMRMLNAHPEVLCRGEGRFFGGDYMRPDIKNMDSKTLQPSSMHRALLEADYLRAWIERSVWTRDEDPEQQLNALIRAITSQLLTADAARVGKPIVGDKTPFIGKNDITEIAEIYPDAKVLHIVRDGRDVAVSAMHHLWSREIDLGSGRDLRPPEKKIRNAYRRDPQGFIASGRSIFTRPRLSLTARDWATKVSQAMIDGPRLLGPNYAEVRYEDLLKRPEEEMTRVLNFLGADSSPESVAASVEGGRFENWTKGRERGSEDSAHLLRKGIAGDWRGVFTEQDKNVFKAKAGDLLIQLGYERDREW